MRFKNLKVFLLLLLVLPQMGCEENTIDTSAALEEVFLKAEQLSLIHI